jgi:membrane-associated HD superfamily phosphohydrolase
MKDFILKAISFVFHPLIMPLLGVLFYFHKTPRFIPEPLQNAKIFSIVILTIILPILLFFLLKTINKVETIYLKSTKERLIPLLINCIIITLILIRVLTPNEIIELYYFFLGILCSTLACFIMAIFKVKASIHMIAASGFFMFAVAIGIHFQININGTIALMMLILGAIATSRLHLKAHSNQELIIGVFTGLFPQLILMNYWL